MVFGQLALAALLATPSAAAAPAAATAPASSPGLSRLPPVTAYPPARRDDVRDVLFGVTVADPYRWLEQDLRTSPEVRAWAQAETALTQAYLAGLPGREAVRARLTQVWDFEKLGAPRARGGRLFFTRNSGLQN